MPALNDSNDSNDSNGSTEYTGDGLREFARALDALAAKVPTGLPGEQGLQMMRWCQALGGAAANLRLLAVEDYLARTPEPLRTVVDATREAEDVVADIAKFDKAVEVIGDVMLLATAIWLRKWALVAPTLNELRKDVRDIKGIKGTGPGGAAG